MSPKKTAKSKVQQASSWYESLERWLDVHRILMLLVLSAMILVSALVLTRHETFTLMGETNWATPADVSQVGNSAASDKTNEGVCTVMSQLFKIGLTLDPSGKICFGLAQVAKLSGILNFPPILPEGNPDLFQTVFTGPNGSPYIFKAEQSAPNYYQITISPYLKIAGMGLAFSLTGVDVSFFDLLALIFGLYREIFVPSNPNMYINQSFPPLEITVVGKKLDDREARPYIFRVLPSIQGWGHLIVLPAEALEDKSTINKNGSKTQQLIDDAERSLDEKFSVPASNTR